MKKFETILKKFDTERGIIFNGIEFNPVPGLKTIYASKCGKIYSSYTKSLKYTVETNAGYTNFPCYKNGKSTTMILSRAVLLAWAEFPNNLTEEEFFKDQYAYEANHINDQNKNDNSISNLEWVDKEYNLNYGTKNERLSEHLKGNQNAKGRKSAETYMRYKYFCDDIEYENINKLAEEMGVSKSALTEAFRLGKTKCAGKNISREALPKKVKKEPTRHYGKEKRRNLFVNIVYMTSIII